MIIIFLTRADIFRLLVHELGKYLVYHSYLYLKSNALSILMDKKLEKACNKSASIDYRCKL